MNILSLENVSKAFGDKVLFENINLQVSQGDKVALVAKNGNGKTTLLKIIAGEEPAEGESAKVYLNKDIRLGYLKQEPEFNPTDTVLEAIFDSDQPIIQALKAYEMALALKREEDINEAAMRLDDLKAWDYEAKAEEVLFNLKMNQLDQTVDSLSGGQKKRLALAKLIIEEPEFIIMDEPTNHLDLEMVEWLEEYLQKANLTICMVTHDRYFLDRVCNLIYEIDNQQLYKYKGNYAYFLEHKFDREHALSSRHDKAKKLFKRELEWVRRMPKARGTKAKARVHKFHEIKEEVYSRTSMSELKLTFPSARLGSKVLELHHISKGFDDLQLIKGFSYKFKKGEKVGIIGPNGSGKSTLLHLLTKVLKPDQGKIVHGGTLEIGHYEQDGLVLKKDKRVIDVIRDIAEVVTAGTSLKLDAARILDRFLFNRRQQEVYVSQLSGGEKRRLYLLTVLMKLPNFLILDEPTNDLDLITLNILEEYLLEFEGCTVIVSHDRYFMDKIVDHLFVFEGNGMIRDFPGNYTEYRDWKQNEVAKARKVKPQSQQKSEKAKASTDNGLTFEQKKTIKNLEKSIERLEAKKSEIMNKFHDTSLTSEEITQLSKDLEDLNSTIEEKEMQWLELHG
ncbi:MAG: ABC-F family ATP-binding cassette domain-containing protein [Bacteroidia bacterium]|nr:ABC-F family ATP-binding cassette domain-containing protein [Bacteroidia bacterium]